MEEWWHWFKAGLFVVAALAVLLGVIVGMMVAFGPLWALSGLILVPAWFAVVLKIAMRWNPFPSTPTRRRKMHSDDEPIDPWESLRHQPLWFRLRWRFLEWRRQRYLRRLYRAIDNDHEGSTLF